ncbi:MAG: acyltransferase [Halioglobus sp.]
MGHINTLTGLRGMAAFIVFVSHCANLNMLPGFLGNGFGQIGVMIFFILSGFLMGYLYLDKNATGRNIRQYIIARVGRVFPLYILLICISVLISLTIYPEFHYHITNPQIVLRALLFIDAPFEFWTIPVEVQFYIVFIIFWSLYARGTGAFSLALFAIMTIIPSAIVALKLGFVPAVFSTYSLSFFVGILTALNYTRISQSRWCVKTAAVLALPCLIALLLNLPAVRLEAGWVLAENFFVRTWADPLNWLIVYGVFFCAMLNVRQFKFFKSRPVVFLGEISFGFYLLHYPILKLIHTLGFPQSLQFLLCLVLTTVLAWLSYTYFEKPVNLWIRKASARFTQSPVISRMSYP